MSKVLLFTGTETYKWSMGDFQDACNFCKAHRIDGLVVKIWESTQGEWYGGWLGGPQGVSDLVTQNELEFIPYGYYYANESHDTLATIPRYAARFGNYVMDLEEGFDGETNNAIDAIVNTLTVPPAIGKIWVSTWANPVDHGWLNNISKLDRLIDVWMPMDYSDGLIKARIAQFPKVIGEIYPTYEVGQETITMIDVTATPSLWEYQSALENTAWVDSFVQAMKGEPVVATPTDKWFEYPVCVPFGNPAFDARLGGSHDLDIAAPPNLEVTSIVSGTVSDISPPLWGWQVGILLDQPYEGIRWFHYLHLSAVNPALHLGSHVSIGDLIGWVGGGNTDADYAGTSNPTGSNKLNDTFNSSRIQIGIALMRGPAYGGPGWTNFPPIDFSLDPTPILLAARSALKTNTARVEQFRAAWMMGCGITLVTNIVWKAFESGIYNISAQAHLSGAMGLCMPITPEFPLADVSGNMGICQLFSNGFHAMWFQGQGTIYNSLDQPVFQGHQKKL